MRPLRRIVRSLAVVIACAAPLARPAHSAEITVLAAASLTDALRESAPRFARDTGHTLRFSFGASGTLARQIEEGAPADVFISADTARMDRLEKANLLAPATRRDLLTNTLVIVVAAEKGPTLAQLSDLQLPAVRRIAVGDPAVVPAGTYAKAYLEKHALWQPLSPKLIPVDSVRAALTAVESGNADAGFVYRTDALSSNRIRIALQFSPPEGPVITYPMAVLANSRQAEAARAFLVWLATAPPRETFAKHGFTPSP